MSKNKFSGWKLRGDWLMWLERKLNTIEARATQPEQVVEYRLASIRKLYRLAARGN